MVRRCTFIHLMLYRQTISYCEVLVQMFVGETDRKYKRVNVLDTTNVWDGMLLGRILTKTWVKYSRKMCMYVQCAHCIVVFCTLVGD